MNLLESLSQLLGIRRNSNEPIHTPSKASGDSIPAYRPSVIIDLPVPPERKASEYIKAYRHYVMRCVSARASEVSAIQLHLYRRKGKDWVEVDEHALLNLLARPNPVMTKEMFFENMQAYCDLSGESFWWIIRDKGSKIPKELWSIRPDWVEVKVGKDKFIDHYIFSAGGSSDPKDKVTIPAEDMLYFRTFNPENPYRGLSLVKASAYEIDAYDYSAQYNRNFFYNSARPSGILTTETNLKDETRRRLEETWQNKYAGKENAFKTAILEGGLKWQDMTFSQKDMDFANLKTMSRDDILALFQTPKTVIGISDDVNRANAKESRAVFQEFVIDPLMRRAVNFLNQFLVPQFGDDLFLDFDPPAPADITASLRYYESGIQNRWLSIDEVREKEGLDIIDSPYTQAPLMPLSLVPVNLENTNSGANGNSSDNNNGGNSNSGDSSTDNTSDSDKSVKNSTVKVRKLYLTPPTRPIKEIIEDKVKEKLQEGFEKDINPKMEAIIKTMFKHKEISDSFAKDVKKTEKSLKGEDSKNTGKKKDNFSYSEEVKDGFYKQFSDRAYKYEDTLKVKVRRLFIKQEAEVLKRLKNSDLDKIDHNNIKKGIGDIIFDTDTENKLFADILIPVLHDLIRDTGVSIDKFLGTANFNPNMQRVLSYLAGEGGAFIRSINTETRRQIIQSLSAGISGGEGIDALAERVRSVYSQATTYRAEMIARTESIRSSNFATEEAYLQSNVVSKKEWLTSKDERVCEWCAPMDGKILNLDEQFFKKGSSYSGLNGGLLKFNLYDVKTPPLHPNCRCTLLPVTVDDPQTPTSFKNSQVVMNAFDMEGFIGTDQQTRNATALRTWSKNFDWAGGFVDSFDWEVRLLNIKNDVSVHSWQDGDKVDEYVQSLKRGDKFPPMLAIRDTVEEGKYTIMDGAHRTEALKKLGAENIYLIVTDPTKARDLNKNLSTIVQKATLSDNLIKEKWIPERARELIEVDKLDPELANFRACLEFYIRFFELDITIPN